MKQFNGLKHKSITGAVMVSGLGALGPARVQWLSPGHRMQLLQSPHSDATIHHATPASALILQ